MTEAEFREIDKYYMKYLGHAYGLTSMDRTLELENYDSEVFHEGIYLMIQELYQAAVCLEAVHDLIHKSGENEVS